uniref:HIG1 domain-containing protein n=1 Tax=Panagrolaimus superbus TaxID=310955 RepID=A0A914YYB9_9BILA
MDFLGRKILSLAGIHKASMQTTDSNHIERDSRPHYSTHRKHDSNSHSDEPKKRQRYTGIPAVPSDIAYNSGTKTSGGSHSTGFMSNASGNPAVIVGMGLTTVALLGMIRRSVLGDKIGTQKYMRYRIMAQFFTVFALVAGVTVFAKNPNVIKEDKPAAVIANSAN